MLLRSVFPSSTFPSNSCRHFHPPTHHPLLGMRMGGHRVWGRGDRGEDRPYRDCLIEQLIFHQISDLLALPRCGITTQHGAPESQLPLLKSPHQGPDPIYYSLNEAHARPLFDSVCNVLGDFFTLPRARCSNFTQIGDKLVQ